MAAMFPDGRAAEIPMGRPRSRGRVISDASVIRMRDLVIALLLDGAGLSPADTKRVLERAQIGARVIRRRMTKCPRQVHEIVGALRREAPHAP